MPRYSFKEFISDEGLDQNKHKSFIRVGWDGRQTEIDGLDDLIARLRELSTKNFEKFEKARAEVVLLQEKIEEDRIAIAKTQELMDENAKLALENKNINVMLEKIAKDLAESSMQSHSKDKRIAELEEEIAELKQ